jgi:hypothetical protein
MAFESQQYVLEGGLDRSIGQSLQLFLRVDQQFGDGRFDMFRLNLVERDLELDFE